MEEALHDVALYRKFAKLDGAAARPPDGTTILRFRQLPERHGWRRTRCVWLTACCSTAA